MHYLATLGNKVLRESAGAHLPLLGLGPVGGEPLMQIRITVGVGPIGTAKP